MSTRVLDRIEEWDTRPFTGGYRTLQQLADQEFSGVVRADGLELFLTRGVAVDIRGGQVAAFEDASGTIYEARSPALPLLAVMQEQSDEVRDRFYTEQTPLSTVDETLSAGGFTGYIELSENVLSGDYYLVYHAGKSTSVAFVGQSGRLVRGSEAFEAAEGEVGIYQVRPVELSPVELPEPEPPEPTAEPPGTPPAELPDNPAHGESADEDGEPTDEDRASAGENEETGPAAPEREPAGNEPEPQSTQPTAASAEPDEKPTAAGDSTADPGSGAEPEVRVIPSVEPARTTGGSAGSATPEPDTDGPTASAQSSPGQGPVESDEGSGEPTSPPDESGSGQEARDIGDATDAAAVDRFERRLDELEAECEALRERLDELQAERDELRDHLTAIRAERDER